jgi:protease PrsW
LTTIPTQAIYALLGGLIPALIWLFFWLREDLHPEPKRLILKAFIVGIITIPFALFGEAFIYCVNALLFLTPAEASFCATETPLLRLYAPAAGLVLLVGFAAVEEIVKYAGAKRFLLKGKDFDEPVDAMIYLITVALGFAAFENFFFLLSAFGNSFFEGIVITNLRFLGATLLHAVSSGIVGYAIALSFYKGGSRTQYTIAGLLAATALHALFNLLVMSKSENAIGLGQALSILVLTGLFLIFAFDRAKKIKQARRFIQHTTPSAHPSPDQYYRNINQQYAKRQ